MKNSHIKNFEFYKSKKVFVTGITGFKGTWMALLLKHWGANVLGYALPPIEGCLYEKIGGEKTVSTVFGDVRDFKNFEECLKKYQPEVVIHFAALALVKDCYDDPVRAYSTNVMGTVNLLEISRHCESIKSIVIATTDKVYNNKGDDAVYREEDYLSAEDPYGNSKVCIEGIVKTYMTSYYKNKDVGIATVRASNVIGGGDNIQSRLIPSILNAVYLGKAAELRNPTQTRPWQSVLDAANGYLTVARYLFNNHQEYSGAWNIGPYKDGIKTVEWIYNQVKKSFSSLNRTSGKILDVHESATLGLDISKAVTYLDWEPRLTINDLIDQVVDFYVRQMSGENEYDICKSQIENFVKK